MLCLAGWLAGWGTPGTHLHHSLMCESAVAPGSSCIHIKGRKARRPCGGQRHRRHQRHGRAGPWHCHCCLPLLLLLLLIQAAGKSAQPALTRGEGKRQSKERRGRHGDSASLLRCNLLQGGLFLLPPWWLPRGAHVQARPRHTQQGQQPSPTLTASAGRGRPAAPQSLPQPPPLPPTVAPHALPQLPLDPRRHPPRKAPAPHPPPRCHYRRRDARGRCARCGRAPCCGPRRSARCRRCRRLQGKQGRVLKVRGETVRKQGPGFQTNCGACTLPSA